MQHTTKTRLNISKLRGKCPSGKVRLRDKIEAVHVLHNRLNQRQQDLDVKGASKAQEIRAYKCPECRGFHLTKSPTRNNAQSSTQTRTSNPAINQNSRNTFEAKKKGL